MSFLNPIALWGLLAISIPLLIHLWNGKRGKTIAWAAMDFLADAESRVSKRIQLENLLVLMLRVLMISCLVFLLAQLFWSGSKGKQEKKIAHLLTGEKTLWEEFRFEIQQALDRDEMVILADNPAKEITSLDELFGFEMASTSNLQSTLDELEEVDSLILYLSNSSSALKSHYYSSPVLPSFQIGEASARNSKTQFIKTHGNRFFALNETGILDSIQVAEGNISTFDFSDKAIPVLIENSETESQFIEAALASIFEVYGINFRRTGNLDSADLVFSNKDHSKINPKKLYFLLNSSGYSEFENQIRLSDSLTFTESELIRKGKIPELILEKFLGHLGNHPKPAPLDSGQFASRFLLKSQSFQTQEANMNEWLLGFLFVILFLERYLAFKQRI
jgi:hypothetical protein